MPAASDLAPRSTRTPSRATRTLRTIAAAAALLGGASRAGLAQRALDAVDPSAIVRLRVADVRLEGTVVRAASDSLLFQSVSGPSSARRFEQRWVPVTCLGAASVADGRAPAGHWAATGGAAGLVAGAALGATAGWLQARSAKIGGGTYANEPLRRPAVGPYVRSRATWIGAIAAVAGIGGGIAWRPSRWQPLALPLGAGNAAAKPECAAFRF